MTINAVFRMQCDGPCHGWLSLPAGCAPGTPTKGLKLEVRETSERAALWPGERLARRAAQWNGWDILVRTGAAPNCLCPQCKRNPLGIRLPPPGLPDYGAMYTDYVEEMRQREQDARGAVE